MNLAGLLVPPPGQNRRGRRLLRSLWRTSSSCTWWKDGKGSQVARWPGGEVIRWPGGQVIRWSGDQVIRWPGGVSPDHDGDHGGHLVFQARRQLDPQARPVGLGGGRWGVERWGEEYHGVERWSEEWGVERWSVEWGVERWSEEWGAERWSEEYHGVER